MSFADPGRSRPRRNSGSVDYTNKKGDYDLAEALSTQGDHDSLDAHVGVGVGDSDGDDAASEAALSDPSSSDYEGSEWEDGEDGEDGGGRKKAMHRDKSQQERDAEHHLCIQLGLDPTKGGFEQMRSSIGYIYNSVCRNSKVNAVRLAYHKLLFDNPLDPEVCNRVIHFAMAIADSINVPEAEVKTTFLPLSNFNGGFFTKTSQHINEMFAIAVMAVMVEKLGEYRANGSAQQQGMTHVLSHIGLDHNAVALLAAMHSTQTPEESARVEGQRVAERFNALPPQERIACLFGSLAGFPTKARQFQPAGYRPSRWHTLFWDQQRPKSAVKIARVNGAAMVSVNLVLRDYKVTSGFVSCGTADAFSNALPDGHKMGQAEYKPLDRMTGAGGEGGLHTNSYTNQRDGKPVVTHRAHTMVYNPSPKTVVGAATDLLFSTRPEVVKNAAKFKEFLESTGHFRGDSQYVLPGPDNGNDGSFYVGVVYNGRALKLGRLNKRHRTCSIKGWDNSCNEPPYWLRLDPELMHKEFAAILVPPYCGFETGTVDFFVMFSTSPPSENVLDMSELRWYEHDQALGKAKEGAERTFLRDRKKRRLSDLKDDDMPELQRRIKTVQESVAIGKRPVTEDFYPNEAYPLWHDKNPASTRVKGDASRRRDEVRRLAGVATAAMAEFKQVIEAAPGGAGTAAASASFQANGGGA